MSGFAVLDGRLSAAAEYVRQGARFADVGTDHARLPLFLLQSGRTTFAVASDVAEGPLERAAHAVRESGVDPDKIELKLTDGLAGLGDFSPTDIAICGMGGDLIARILSDADFIRDPKIRLILQPMTRAGRLRAYLAESGFAVLSETYCRASGRPYVCLLAAYDGKPRTPSPLVCEIGEGTVRRESEPFCFRDYLMGRLADRNKELAGLRSVGDTAGAERVEALVFGMQEALKHENEKTEK